MLCGGSALTESNYGVYNTMYRGTKAGLLFRYKFVLKNGEIVAVKAWAVPRSARTPEGIKYSLVYIDRDRRRVLGYDNAEGKGHHRHEGAQEASVDFESIHAHIARFMKELRENWGIVL